MSTATAQHLAPPRSRKTQPDLAGLSLTDLLAKLADLEKTTADRDHWKTRARKAEQALATLRKALGG